MKKIILMIVLALNINLIAYGAGNYRSKIIFPLQEKHVHASSIVECPDGQLIACWYYGSGERRANDVIIQGARLKKGGNKWSPVFEMADTPELPDCNPVLFIDKNDQLKLFWIGIMANGWEHSILRYRTSSDYLTQGPPKWSWQDIIILKPGDAFPNDIQEGFKILDNEDPCWATHASSYSKQLIKAAKQSINRQKGWMTRIKPTVLPSGRILLPLYSDGFNISLIGISDDHGISWRASKPIVGWGPVQPAIARKKNGTLVAYMRDNGRLPKRMLISTSKDEGETWTPAVDMDIPNPGSSVDVLVLADGRWVMMFNDPEKGRHRLALALSDDEGKTWKWTRLLEKEEYGKGYSFSYPAIIQGKDGTIHATYTYRIPEGNSIKHVAFDAEWIIQGDLD